MFDVVVVGAGVVGCSIARSLASRGLRVCLIDRAAPGQEASHAAAGMLAPSAEAEAPSAFFDFVLRSRRMYPAFAAELREETGIDPQYRAEGTLMPFHTAEQSEQLRAHLEWQTRCGVRVERLDAAQLRAAEPQLGDFAGAYLLPEDHQINNRLLVQALDLSCRLRGVVMQLGAAAQRIIVENGRATGVELAPASATSVASDSTGTTITAANVINASGAWAAQLTGVAALPVRPVKGHMLALRTAPPDAAATLRHVIRTPDVYLIPRRDGRIIVGSTMEEAGFDKTIHAEPLERLRAAAERACPALTSAARLEAWTGLRPATPDGLPIIGPLSDGPLPGVAGCWAALGHFRNGILLAPATAELITGWLVDGRVPPEASAFSPGRFL